MDGSLTVNMTFIDSIIIVFTLAMFFLFFAYWRPIVSLQLTKAFTMIMLGMMSLASIYVSNLYDLARQGPIDENPIQSNGSMSMYISEDMETFLTMGGVILISLGMIYLFSNLLPKLNSRIKQAAQTQLRIEQQFETIYHETPSIFITVNRDGVIKAINKYGANRLSINPHTIGGTSLYELICVKDIAIQKKFLKKAFEFSNSVMDIEIRLKTSRETILWVNQSARITISPSGEKHLLLACQDISTAKELSFKLQHQANHDELTGLPNRRALTLHLEHLLDKTKRAKANHAFLYIDLDQLKIVNDTCGHVAGDGLLKQLSLVIKGTLRVQDICARIGGDEFAILLEHCSEAEGYKMAEIIRNKVEEFIFVWNRHSFRQSISIGLVGVNKETVDTNSILSCADAACYEAKEQGRNRTVLYEAKPEATSSASHEEMFWVRRLQRGMQNNNLLLYFQPIVKSQQNPFGHLHYEVLVRFLDKNGIVSPDSFLPAAKRFNLSDQLDIWVIKNTIEFLKTHPAHTHKLSCCSINLSCATLTSHAAQDKIIDLIVNAGFPTNKLCFEIPETIAVSHLNEAQQFMHRLRHLGVKFALDDFGSGVSSFGYIKQLPIDYIKIDGVFVRDVAEDNVDKAMVSAINNVGHELGIQTVAEFVENDSIENVLAEIGVDFMQGYHQSKPRPLAEIERYYAA